MINGQAPAATDYVVSIPDGAADDNDAVYGMAPTDRSVTIRYENAKLIGKTIQSYEISSATNGVTVTGTVDYSNASTNGYITVTVDPLPANKLVKVRISLYFEGGEGISPTLSVFTEGYCIGMMDIADQTPAPIQWDASVSGNKYIMINGTTSPTDIVAPAGLNVSIQAFAVAKNLTLLKISNADSLAVNGPCWIPFKVDGTSYAVPLNVINGQAPAATDYTVRFVNYDGSELIVLTIASGIIPQYDAIPVRDSDCEYDYLFEGWYPAIVVVSEDATYTATYTSIPRVYEMSFGTNSGSGSMDSRFGGYNSIVVLPECGLSAPAGMEFKCWSIDNVEMIVGSSVVLTSNTVALAIWVVKPVPIDESTIGFNSDAECVVIDLETSNVADVLADTSKKNVAVTGNGWEMQIPKEIITGATGTVSISAQILDESTKSALPESIKTRIEGKVVYSLGLSDSNGKISFTGKTITVSLPYELSEGADPANVKVFYINGDNIEQIDASYNSDKKVAVFTTDHFSDWFVDVVESPSEDDNNDYILWGVAIFTVVELILICAGAFYFMRSKGV